MLQDSGGDDRQRVNRVVFTALRMRPQYPQTRLFRRSLNPPATIGDSTNPGANVTEAPCSTAMRADGDAAVSRAVHQAGTRSDLAFLGVCCAVTLALE